MIKAVIFDLDGTIGNTLPLCVAAFRCAIEPLSGQRLSDREIYATFGPSEEGTIMQLVPQHYRLAVEDYLVHYDRLHQMCPQPFEGIREILQWLRDRGIAVALVTGKGARSCAITLEKYGIGGFFDQVETGSPEGQRKKEGIESVLGRLGLTPAEAVYVGDAPSDITASRAAGVGIIAAGWAETADVETLAAMAPDRLFTSVARFRDYLETAIGPPA